MRSRATRAGLALLALALTLPVALVATFALTPFWRWLETTLHVEAIGHSGPAAWCFGAVEALCVAAVVALRMRRR